MNQNHDRRYYLSDIPVEQALAKLLQVVDNKGIHEVEVVPLRDAVGRVTARPIWAKISSPHYDAAAMDGVAVLSSQTTGATETKPISLVHGTDFEWVDTGDPMPSQFDAVVMIEVIVRIDDHTIELRSPVAPYQDVRPLGEDMAATELVLPPNHLIRPIDLGASAAAGITNIPVLPRPKAILIPTGNELVKGPEELVPGDIIEFNSLMVSGMIKEWGGNATVCEPVPDDYELIKDTIRKAIDVHDIIIIIAGSSAGSEDYTANIVEDLGELVVHGIAIRPGHPLILGTISKKIIIGLPGYPVSCVLTSELFIKPLIEAFQGIVTEERHTLNATLTRKLLSPIGDDEYVRVMLGQVGEKLVATPLQRGAGVITSLTRADGITVIPRFSDGLDAGSTIIVDLLRPARAIKNSIIAVGSHDMTLDLMASRIKINHPSRTLSSSNIGSVGGLLALSREEAHIAGSHLLDPETGLYNISYIYKYIKDKRVVVINLVHRVQGLMIPKGNPKTIFSLRDITREDVSFVNRQRGSGTRVLLDYKLSEMGLNTRNITGYNREEYTHLSVAATVAGGGADCGLGILPAAKALGLDFVPISTEQYDLIMPEHFYEAGILQPVVDIINDPEFKNEIERLGGYDVSNMGDIIAALP